MNWSQRHLIDVDALEMMDIEFILSEAEKLRRWTDDSADGGVASFGNLRGRDVALLFAEPSTRTRLSFELAARRLGAETYVIDPVSSSMVKGETLVDTVRNLDALGFRFLVIRHHRAGAAAVAARYFGGSVVNAGDGWHAHPTQALLDLFTLADRFRSHVAALDVRRDLRGRKVAIVGDVLHSRVAKSNVWSLRAAGVEVWLCGPSAWLRGLDDLPVSVTDDLDLALRGADVVMGLRVQKERMAPGVSVAEYVARYQITDERLTRAAPAALYMHPGPINEGVEVARSVARGPRSLVLDQARNGVFVRMAVLALLGDRLEPRSTQVQHPLETYVRAGAATD